MAKLESKLTLLRSGSELEPFHVLHLILLEEDLEFEKETSQVAEHQQLLQQGRLRRGKSGETS